MRFWGLKDESNQFGGLWGWKWCIDNRLWDLGGAVKTVGVAQVLGFCGWKLCSGTARWLGTDGLRIEAICSQPSGGHRFMSLGSAGVEMLRFTTVLGPPGVDVVRFAFVWGVPGPEI